MWGGDIQSDYGAEASGSVKRDESEWMAHWTRTSSRKLTGLDVNVGSDNLILEYNNAWRSQQGSMVVASDVPFQSKKSKVECEVRGETADTPPKFNSRSLRNEIWGHHNRPVGTSNTKFSSRLFKLDPTEIDFPSKDNQFQPKSVSETPMHFIKPYNKKTVQLLNPSQDDLARLTSDIVPYGLKSERVPIRSPTYRKNATEQSSLRVVSEEHLVNTDYARVKHECRDYHSYSTFLVCGNKTDSQIISKSLGSSSFGVKNGDLQLNDTTRRNVYFPDQGKSKREFCGAAFSTKNDNFCASKEGKSKSEFSGTTFSTKRSTSPHVTKLEEQNHGFHFLHRMPSCSGHVEMSRMPASLSSLDGFPSDRAHCFLTTEKTDVNTPKGDQLVKESRLSTNSKRITSHEILSRPSNSACHDKRRVEAQPQESSKDAELNKKVGTCKTASLDARNESSAEADIMDMDDFQAKNSLPGFVSSPSKKVLRIHLNSSKSQAAVASARVKVGFRKREIETPDINLEPPSVLEVDCSGDRNLNSLRTETLDNREYLDPKAPRDVLLDHPSNRLAKRMRLSASNSKAELEFCSIGSVKEREELPLSHPWIRRWYRNRTVTPWAKSAVPLRYIEPENSNAALEEFQRNKSPSTAAMALMGKATNCFQPCELRKKGSVIVWNTDGF
ncbi:hypothetical protein GIB67_002618 [Kingdonia uniflora]|uniref:Uncharacterized protein n=1 Tax=Kingdonia uniflora TaxID=39325 RepID=A0A7J7N4A9_9MAGN|nr:hypothetical protein GIB67_002618 [Kingdonia uniflora]